MQKTYKMEDKFAEINKLKDYIKQILSMYENEKQKNSELNINIEKLISELNEKKELINNLKNKTQTLKIAKIISLSEEDKQEVKNKINKIVREIDKSIGLLNE